MHNMNYKLLFYIYNAYHFYSWVSKYLQIKFQKQMWYTYGELWLVLCRLIALSMSKYASS